MGGPKMGLNQLSINMNEIGQFQMVKVPPNPLYYTMDCILTPPMKKQTNQPCMLDE